MRFDFIPAVICPNCGKASELPGGEMSDPFHCPKCQVTSVIGKKDCQLMKRDEFEAATQL